jgi:hypothetical protein
MNKLKLLSSSFIMALTLAAPFATYAMELDDDHRVAPAARPFNIHTYMALGLKLTDQHMNPIYHSTPKLADYPRFLNGKLIYKPDPNSDEGMVVLPIADLPNPLDGEFDLSQCGDAAQYLSINTGYRTGKRPENEDKFEIWFAPHFLIKKNLERSSSHFQKLMASWDAFAAPVGTFFTWGGWSDLNWYDYVTTLGFRAYNDPQDSLQLKYISTVTTESLTFSQPAYTYDQHTKLLRHFFMSF